MALIQRDFTEQLKTYHEHEAELQKYPFHWVVIVGTNIAGVYDTFEEAVFTGSEQHGLENIFVHEIMPPGYVPFLGGIFDLGKPGC